MPTTLPAHRWFAYKQKMLWACWAGDLELQDWQRNYCLNPVTSFTLFDEFMEMSAWGMGRGWLLGR